MPSDSAILLRFNKYGQKTPKYKQAIHGMCPPIMIIMM